MSIEAVFSTLNVSWGAIRQSAIIAHSLKLNMRSLEVKYGFNATNAEETCESDAVFDEWLDLRDRAEVENLRLAHLVIGADEDGLLALVSKILAKTNVKDLS